MSVITLADAYIRKFYPGAFAAILTGSGATGESLPNSDLDIVIISTVSNTPYFEKHLHEGKVFELIILPFNRLTEILEYSLRAQSAAYLKMLAKGKVIRDRGNFARSLVRYAISKLRQGYPNTPMDQVQPLLISLTNLIDDLSDDRPRDEQLFIMQELVPEISKLMLVYHRRWQTKGKLLSRQVKALDPDWHARLVSATETFYKKDDKAPILKLATQTLADLGLSLKHYSTRMQLTEVVTNGRLFIGIKGDFDKQAFARAVLPRLTREILPKAKSLYLYDDLVWDFRVMIRIAGEDQYLKEEVLPRLTQLLEETAKTANPPLKWELKLPYNPLVPGLFGGEQALEILETFFTDTLRLLGTLVKDAGANWNQQVVVYHLLFLHIAYSRSLTGNLEKALYFNLHLLRKWLPQAYDYNHELPYPDLVRKRKTTLAQFETAYGQMNTALTEARQFFLGYAELEEGPAWLRDWQAILKTLHSKIHQLEASGQLTVLQYLMHTYPEETTEAETRKAIIYGSAIEKVFGMFGLYNRNFGLLPYLLLRWAGQESEALDQYTWLEWDAAEQAEATETST